MQEYKKQLEERVLSEFISNPSFNRKISLIEEGNEPPDFILKEGKKKISVELTRLIHPDTMQKEALYEKLTAMAKKIFNEKYRDELYVLINFSDIPLKLKQSEEGKYAKEIFEIVEEIFLLNRKYNFQVSSKFGKHINSYIDSFDISNSRNFDHWQPFGAFIVDFADFKMIQKKIITKEKGIVKYPEKYDEHWLLLLANFGHKSSTYTFYDLHKHEINSSFDKIYLYLQMEQKVIELK